jgi:GGDEF domain-containing protein
MARTKAEQLAHAVAAKPVGVGVRIIGVRVTYGVHSLEAGDDAAAMIEKADHAMYARKRRSEAPPS